MLTFQLLIYCVLIAFASLAGGWLPSLVRMTHLRKQLLMSFVSGTMLGVALLHMLPLAIDELRSSAWVGGSVMVGLLVMFFLLRVFHAHTHDDGHGHSHDHDHDHGGAQRAEKPGKRIGWSGLLLGLTIHSLFDGVALSVSMQVEAGDSHAGGAWLGLGTFFAVFLHKPLDALAITSLMQATRWPKRARGIVNALFALSAPAGAFAFWFGASQLGAGQSTFTGVALAFCAGFFICIALSDLLPEVAFHSHDRGKLSFALLLGVALACGVEMMHTHDHGEHSPTDESPHQHHDH